MKEALIAGVIGAALLTVAMAILTSQGSTNVPAYTTTVPVGFAVGAGVQISVRLLGVS